MITHIPYSELGNADYGWLNAHYHFSFAHYFNRKRMGFGVLRVINDDIIKAGKGFDTHHHDNMEIITYVKSGAITHKDSKGNEGRTGAGDLQVMSAGTGIAHSEFNNEDEDTSLYQIWITPRAQNLETRWEAMSFPKKESANQLPLLVSGTPNDGALTIYQDAYIYGGQISENKNITHNIHNQAYILISKGHVEIDEIKMSKGDGAEVRDQKSIEISALTDSEILIIDVPSK